MPSDQPEKLDLVMEKYKNKGDLKSSDVPIVEKLLERNWPNTDITHVMAMDMVRYYINRKISSRFS